MASRVTTPASAAAFNHQQYYITDPTSTEIVTVAGRRRDEIARQVLDAGVKASSAIPPPRPVSKAKYIYTGMIGGVAAGAAVGAGSGALAGTFVFPGIGTAAGAAKGAVVGGVAGGIIGARVGYLKAKKADGINYYLWLQKLPIAEVHAFKLLFSDDPELRQYLCGISQEILQVPACLPCHHVYNFTELSRHVKKYHVCPYCNQKGDVELAPEIFLRMNATFLKILKSGIAGRKLTKIQQHGFSHLLRDLEDRTESVWRRVVDEASAKADAIVTNPGLTPARKVIECQKEHDKINAANEMRMKLLLAQAEAASKATPDVASS